MSKVGDFLRKIAARKNTSSNSKALGSVILKPSEATPSVVKKIQSSGGSVQVVSGSMSSQIPSGNIQQALRSSGGGGTLSSSNSAAIQQQNQQKAQQEIARLAEEARKRDQARQQEIIRIQDQAKKRQAMIISEQKRQQDLAKIKSKAIKIQNNVKDFVSKKQDLERTRREFLRRTANKASQIPSNTKKLILSKSKNAQIKQLNKDRDKIYSDLIKVNEKYLDKELTEQEYNKYLREVAPIKTRYKDYYSKKQNILKDLPDKKTISNLEYNPIVGEEVLVLDKKDRSITTSINRGIDKATASLINQKDVAKNTALLTALVAGQSVYEFGKGIVTLPRTIRDIVKNPSLIKQIPAVLKDEGAATGQLLKVSPTAGIVKLGAEVYLWTRGPGDAVKLTRKLSAQSAKLTKAFKGVKTSPLGVQSIKNVNKVGDIEIILQRGTKLKTNPKAVVKNYNVGGKLKKSPTIPKTTSKVEKEVLSLVKKNGDIVTGSFARETLLKKQFSRIHKDLDIASKDIPGLVKLIKNKYGKRASFKVKPNSVLVKINGKEVADLVPLSKAEAGFIKKFGYKTINGLKIANPQAIVGGKATKLGTMRVGVGSSKTLTKTLKDLEKLTGEKLVGKPSLKGAYGNTKKLNSNYLGKSGPLTTAQADLLVKNILNRNPKLKLERWLYATPWEIRTGKAQVRVSRLALKAEEGTILDLLRGRATLKSSKPQIFVLPKQKIFKAGTKLTKSKTIPTKKGFVIPNFTSELEVVLGKGYIISRGKRLGVTLISGEKVPIIELKLTRLTPQLRKEINSLNKLKDKLNKIKNKSQRQKLINEIDKKEISLNSKLKKKTGFDYFSRRPTRKVYPLKKKIISRATKLKKVTRTNGRKTLKRTTPRRKSPKPRSPKKPSPRSPGRTIKRKTGTKSPSKVVRRTTPRSPGRTTRRSPRSPRTKVKNIRKPSSKIKKTTKKTKKPEGYNVYVKSGGKFYKANKKPLSDFQAKDRAAYIVDHSTSATAKIIPLSKVKSLGKIRPQEVGARNKIKARTYKIRKGKKIELYKTIIERRGKPRINTKGEKRGLTAARLIKQLTKKKIKPREKHQLKEKLSLARL